ncbi:MAG: LytTR family transcriptional regulator [Bacteroidetes bacterium HGW-Bacteroidetes-7]|jgi:predicted membrane protein|nr:MAG: LytTR family transcriptional regulator [Bacteroidetes bacterium HGW-Bacteroidetes-7]
MLKHPFKESFERKITGVATSLSMIALLWFTLAFYGQTDTLTAFAISISYLLPLYSALYYYWYINSYFKNLASKTVVAVLSTILSGAVSYAFFAFFEPSIHKYNFSLFLPLMNIIGLSVWIVTIQWYSSISKSIQSDNEACYEEDEADTNDENGVIKNEKLRQITVKEGSRIHIIKTEEVNYIQAYGDYVMLFTANGKHIKEQTMKFFEANLPDTFIRIHRSCIVNSEKIQRAELFGKESYSVYLNDGVCLRASTSGYKLLKERLHF